MLLASVLLGIVGPAVPDAGAQENGIFADFTTSLGGFTCRLDYTNAPKAVANFIGLATGARAWLETPSGKVRTNAFHDGLTFHRVIAGFMIQGGSPNGQGTDGPGYSFPDEFSPSLRHDGPGVLSMANSGPASNGAQFFITVAATSWLDDVHTIFGRVTSGQSVVNAISQVATDANSKPLTPVIVQGVSIRRVGAAAQAFDIEAQILPVVSRVPLGISTAAGQASLTFTNGLYAENLLSTSTNLTSWTSASLGVDLALPATNSAHRAMTAPAQFYALSRVQYPSIAFEPRSVTNRTLTLSFTTGQGILPISFDSSGGGTYTYNTTPGTVTSYTWSKETYRGSLLPIEYSDLYAMVLRFNFTRDSGGSFSGTVYPNYPLSTGAFNVAGTFTLSAP